MIDLPTQDLTITPFTGEFIRGKYVKTPGLAVTFPASVQEMKGNEILLVPEGRRTEQWIKLYTEYRLKESDEKNNIPSDEFLWDGKIFQVWRVSNWSIGTDIPHYKVIAVKKNDEGGGSNE